MSDDIFSGTKLTPERPLCDEKILLVSIKQGVLSILIKVDGDHPELLTIDLHTGTYDVEGYD